MSGGFTWKQIGVHYVIAEPDTGRVLAHVIGSPKNAQDMPLRAYVSGKEVGMYVDLKSAQYAVEEVMADRRREELRRDVGFRLDVPPMPSQLTAEELAKAADEISKLEAVI